MALAAIIKFRINIIKSVKSVRILCLKSSYTYIYEESVSFIGWNNNNTWSLNRNWTCAQCTLHILSESFAKLMIMCRRWIVFMNSLKFNCKKCPLFSLSGFFPYLRKMSIEIVVLNCIFGLHKTMVVQWLKTTATTKTNVSNLGIVCKLARICTTYFGFSVLSVVFCFHRVHFLGKSKFLFMHKHAE